MKKVNYIITHSNSADLNDYQDNKIPVFEISQNYPNPFNNCTQIKYDLQRNEHVRLILYDIHGKEIRILIDETQSAGVKTVTWDGKDNQGCELSSGIYIYRITANDLTQSRKMVYLK
jgi:FlgD Ig-like domain